MPALNAAGLLAAWEEGISQSSLQRALTLLQAAWPETSRGDWAHVSIGHRDSRLLALREELFGSKLEAVAACPKCSERLELAFSTDDIRVPPPALPAPGEPLHVRAGEFDAQFRLPTSADLLEVAKPGMGAARETLLARCILSATRNGAPLSASDLPDDVVKAVLDEMANADPQADVQVTLACPACQHRWPLAFDIVTYLWNEIEDWAQRLLREIHALACGYGWSEPEILALSPQRRRIYLEMLAG